MRLKKAEREQVRLKYGGRCAYCGVLLGDRWHADHREPVIRVSDERVAERATNHNLDNMMPACAPCNISKGRQTLEGWPSVTSMAVTAVGMSEPEKLVWKPRKAS